MLDIIVVSYNTKDMTLEAIRSAIHETKETSYNLYIVDNASTDGSADAIEKAFPQATLIRSQENLGFAKANNQVVKFGNADHILLLNPDTVVLDGAIDKLYQFAINNPAGIWGGKLLNMDKTLSRNCCWRFISPWSLFCSAIGLSNLFRNSRIFNSEEYGGWDRTNQEYVDIVQGSFMLVSRELWEKLDGLDESYFLYGEEADFCYRAKQLGYKVLYTPTAHIVHIGGQSTPVKSKKIQRILAAKNQFAKNHYTGFHYLACKFFIFFWPLNRLIAYFALNVLNKSKYSSRCSELKSVVQNWPLWRRGFTN